MEKDQSYLSGSTTPGFSTSRVSLLCLLLFTVASLSFSSCRKKEKEEGTEEEDTEQSTANDNNIAENMVADIESMGGQVSDAGSMSTYRMSGTLATEALEAAACAVVTINGQIITVDFGNGCLGKDGRLRSGKLIYNFSNSASGATYYRNPGFNMQVSSQNYVVDGYAVSIGSKVVSNITPNTIPSTPNPGTNLKWSVVANVTVTKPNNGGTITWSCNRTKELMNTSDTTCYKGQGLPITWTKAVVKLNGSASGVNAQSENFTANASNLVRDFNCSPDPVRPHRHPFISGTIAYVPGSRPQRTIDFGNGACDLNATVAIKNKVFNITLP